jgi:hypothetical protein
VYNVGSLSKAVTAIAVMQLLEQKRLTLDDDIRTYVPAFPDKGATITIRHLLTHTSGIRHYRANDIPGTPDNENICPIVRWEDGLRLFAADPDGRLVAYQCGSVKGSDACLVDFPDEDLVAAIATNSSECCGWWKADALAAFFRPDPASAVTGH